jgi:hypothetical protein
MKWLLVLVFLVVIPSGSSTELDSFVRLLISAETPDDALLESYQSLVRAYRFDTDCLQQDVVDAVGSFDHEAAIGVLMDLDDMPYFNY